MLHEEAATRIKTSKFFYKHKGTISMQISRAFQASGGLPA